MDWGAIKKNFIGGLTLFTLLITGICGICLSLSNHYFTWFPLIPAFFYLCSILTIYLVEFGHRWSETKVVSIYIAAKLVKVVLSILVLLVYGFGVRNDIITFALVFIVYYIAFLIFETRFFFCLEAKLKNNKK